MVQTRGVAKRKLEVDTTRDDSEGGVQLSGSVKPAKRGRRAVKSDPTGEGDENKIAPPSIKPSEKRRRGKSAELCQLNLDVLFLIAADLHPIDLLNLARTCKSLRELLMSSASEFVWKTARRQVEVPECPADLTEPQYADLLFCARCHGCGKNAKTLMSHWRIRRRFCQKCRKQSLCPLSSCKHWMRDVLPSELLTIGNNTTDWVETEQMKSIEEEYERTSDKDRFLSERRDQVQAICQHADECILWENALALKQKRELESRQEQREDDVFFRLKELGFQREIAYYGRSGIKRTISSVFKPSKLLTDKEWARIWPKWQHKMEKLRLQRLEQTVYRQRRGFLTLAYDQYVAHLTPSNALPFYLPHADYLAGLPLFQDIIRADEEARIDKTPFESAFQKLSRFVDECKRLDIELAELVKIPSHLSCEGSPNGQTVASHKTTPMSTTSEAAAQKLRLACAVFSSRYLGTYPDVLHFMGPWTSANSDSTQGILSGHNIKFLEDAPYIVHACGLDPNVATPEDMDRKNARLRCLACRDRCINNWRNAMMHAHYSHARKEMPLESRWQIVGDEHMDAILAAESEAHPGSSSPCMRCMLCHPRVGDELSDIMTHLQHFHNIRWDDVREGVHYMRLGFRRTRCVKMVGEGERMTFKDASYEF